MHVIHVITGLGQGGAEAMLEKLVLTARRVDPDITHEVISLRTLGDVGPRLLAQGVRVRALGLRKSPRAVFAAARLVWWLRERRADAVVQTWMYHADLVGGVAAHLAGVRALVWNVRSANEVRAFGTVTRAVVRACGFLSRHLPNRVVTNAHAAIDVHQRLGYDPGRWVVISNGFDTEGFAHDPPGRARVRSGWGLGDEHVVIGLVARLDPLKDHPNFVATAARVASRRPQARFVLVGRGVPHSDNLRQIIQAAGLADRFVLDDQRADVPAVMSALDVFCLASRAEGFPNVLGEAMACETPSVSTDAGDARHLLGHDDLIAPIDDAQALAERVERVLRSSVIERRALGQRMRRRIQTHFGIVRVWGQYRDLYRDLYDPRDSRSDAAAKPPATHTTRPR